MLYSGVTAYMCTPIIIEPLTFNVCYMNHACSYGCTHVCDIYAGHVSRCDSGELRLVTLLDAGGKLAHAPARTKQMEMHAYRGGCRQLQWAAASSPA